MLGVTVVRRAYRVIALTLSTGEPLPALVRSSDWVPARVPMRWAVRRRRFECAPSTLAHDLRAIGFLYEWAESALGYDLDDMLERFDLPTPRQMDSLILALRRGLEQNHALCRLATVANQANAICAFLSWTVDPINQGSAAHRELTKIQEQRAILAEFFRPVTRYSGKSQRIRPLVASELKRITARISPVRNEQGTLVQPLRFHSTNPFRVETRFRNWLMILIALECGLRRGELLKLRIDDVPRRGEDFLCIRRRPHDKDDPRRHKPSVKTVERQLPVTEGIRSGLSAYLARRGPGARRAGGSPYLFVNGKGLPLSISSADDIVTILGHHTKVADLSWHTFRHTWAEALAEDFLGVYPDEQALAFLRQLGGWTPLSMTPLHYIQNALARQANAYLKSRNDRLYGSQVPELG